MRVVKLEEARMPDGVQEAFDRLHAHRWEVARRGMKERLARLEQFKTLLVARREALAEALHADFRKPRAEVEATEVLPVLMELASIQKHLKTWMKPRKVSTPLLLTGTSSLVQYEPRGVVLVMAPWNYPSTCWCRRWSPRWPRATPSCASPARRRPTRRASSRSW